MGNPEVYIGFKKSMQDAIFVQNNSDFFEKIVIFRQKSGKVGVFIFQVGKRSGKVSFFHISSRNFAGRLLQILHL